MLLRRHRLCGLHRLHRRLCVRHLLPSPEYGLLLHLPNLVYDRQRQHHHHPSRVFDHRRCPTLVCVHCCNLA
jgi:hypothetical protein